MQKDICVLGLFLPSFRYNFCIAYISNIVFIQSHAVGMPYEVALSLTQFASLHDRREHLNKKIFSSITLPSSCISGLLPALRDSTIIHDDDDDYVLHPYTPDSQPTATLPLYITLY